MLTPLLSVIEIGLDPTIELGPVTVAWHGLTIAIGIVVGALAAAWHGREERGIATDPLYEICGIVAVAGLVGGKLFYLLEQGTLLDPGEWVDGRGFTFNGGLVLAAVAIAAYLRIQRLPITYLDVVAVGFPLGVAIGRVGDVINGEHYGDPSTWLLAVRNTHPDADVPSATMAYHSGGLYEVLLGLAIFAVSSGLRNRIRQPLMMVWLVVGLFATGRFVEFFFRSDSDVVALGLSSAQWTSLVTLAFAVAGAGVTWRILGRQGGFRRGPHGGQAAP